MPEHKPGVAPTDWPTQLQWIHMHFKRVRIEMDAEKALPVTLTVEQANRTGPRLAVCSDTDLPTVVGLVFRGLSRGHFPEVKPDV